MSKLTNEEFCRLKNEISAKIKDFEKEISDKEYKPLIAKYISDNCEYEIGKVYELVQNGIKRRGFKRFILTDLWVQSFGKKNEGTQWAFIQCDGYWLNEDNETAKQDSMTVFGVGNPAILKLSNNQNYIKKEVNNGK